MVILTTIRRVANTPLHSIPQHRTTTKIRHVKPKLVTKVVLDEVGMKIVECDP
jgi:hypothetical protein